MISVLLPSRGRPGSLQRSITSLHAGRTGHHPVEVRVAADDDDPATRQAAEQAGAVVTLGPRHGYTALHRYINQLALEAIHTHGTTGHWLALWNDDAVMRTPGWDRAVVEHDGQDLVLDPDTNHPPHERCTFPIVPARLVAELGHFSRSPHCDTWWLHLGQALGILRPIPVTVHHDRYDLTGAHNDQTYATSRASQQTSDYYGPEMTALREADIATLRKVLAS